MNNNFQIGQLFKVCSRGFDFCRKVQESESSYRIEMTQFFKDDNHFKYVEVVDKIKHGKRNKYKIKLWHENREVTDRLWSSYESRSHNTRKRPEALYKWVYANVINRKLKTEVLEPCTWGNVAKDELTQSIKVLSDG